MTVREFSAVCEGFAKANGAGQDEAPSEDEYLRVLREEMAAGRA